jgi:hypoxanthine phosphoribosyltransferase
MTKIYYSWRQFDRDIAELAKQIWQSGWKPDYIVGISRGGLPLAVSLSNHMGIPMKPLQVSLRDGGDCVSDLGMAEDAFGYHKEDNAPGGSVVSHRKNILIVDDINDSGATFNWIFNDWPSGCMPKDTAWNEVWGNNVRFATLWDNPASKSKYSMNYTIHTKDPEQEPWIVFPWEELFTGET